MRRLLTLACAAVLVPAGPVAATGGLPHPTGDQ